MNNNATPEEKQQELPPDIKKNIEKIIEALIFASDEPLSASKIKDILEINIDAREIKKIIQTINNKLQQEREPFEIVELGGGFVFRTIAIYQKYLKALFKEKAVRRLSSQALETLAIVAYKQPVSKAEIEGIRNVSTDGAMKTLLEKHLIKMLGKSDEKPGKPIVYGTTKDFLKYFGLNRISDLPKMEEIEEIAVSKEDSKTELIHDLHRDSERTETLVEPEKEVATSAENDQAGEKIDIDLENNSESNEPERIVEDNSESLESD